VYLIDHIKLTYILTQLHTTQNLVKKISVNTGKILENNPKKTSQGYVVFEDKASVGIALQMNNTVHEKTNGLILRVDRCKPTIDSTRSVFVGNLKYEADEMSLRKHFENGCGFESDVIENVRIVRDPETMQCKGFGYILFKDKSYIPYALEMHDSVYMKKELRVLVCGKRFKGKRGAQKEKTANKNGDHVHPAEQRLRKQAKLTAGDILESKDKKKKRGIKKIGAKQAVSSGISKRAAAGKKMDKRMKKIEKRISKGMGKTKK
jgi:nucleolar protein 12